MSKQVRKIQVGDILCASWGYDQTNVDYYVVTKRTPKMVTLQGIGTTIEASDELAMQGSAMPDRNKPEGKPFRKKAQLDARYDDAEWVQLFSWGGIARIWDGKPQRVSWYA